MAHNVLGKRRFCCCDKGKTKFFQQQQKCGGKKYHKGRSPTGFFCSPSRRKAAMRLPIVMRRTVNDQLSNNIGTLIHLFFNKIFLL
jgi:hypothetical protein